MGFLAALDAGVGPMAAMEDANLPGNVGKPHEVASSFCHGRENLLPDVFSAVRSTVDDVLGNAPVFRRYLDRRASRHGRAARKNPRRPAVP